MGITYDHTTINYSGSVTTKKYTVWHDTGVKGQTAAGNASYFRSVDRKSSANYFIDKNEIVEVVDPNLVAWHCGDGFGKYGITNSNSIGIELCPEADGTIHPQTIANAIWLGKKLMKDFGILPENNVRHYDASRKNCPQYLNTDGKWTLWYAFKAQLIAEDVAPVATSGNLVYVDYNATIMKGGYSVDSKPWGEPGFETWSHSDDWLFKTIHFREETADGAYANGDYFGWVDKKALGPERKSVNYKATVIKSGVSVDSLPWGEGGHQLGLTNNHLHKTITVRLESLDGQHMYMVNDQKEIGWVHKNALGTPRREVNYKATVVAGGYSVDTKPWGESGFQRLGLTDNHVGKEVTALMESTSGEYAYIVTTEKELGWVDKKALKKL